MRRRSLPNGAVVRESGLLAYIWSSPKTITTGGMTNGRRVMNSTKGRARGTRRRTQKAVGRTRTTLTMMVMMPMTNE